MPNDKPSSVTVQARVEDCLEIVQINAYQLRRQFGTRFDVDDLMSAGREALVVAAQTFDDSRGVPFRRWAGLRVRGAMVDTMRRSANMPRRVYAQLRAIEAGDLVQDTYIEEDSAKPTPNEVEADSRLGNYLAGIATAMAVGLLAQTSASTDPEAASDHADTPEEALQRAQMLQILERAINERPDAERSLLRRHYFDGLRFEQVAKELGLSKSWASRLHARAIEAVTKTLKKEGAI